MKVSLHLLKTFAKFDEPFDEILTTIKTKIGEVESVEELGTKYNGIVVGRIIATGTHDDADKLSINEVDIGQRKVQVIAGDKTLAVGDKVAYIPPGNVVPVTANKEPQIITVRKIRGIESRGMLASEYELAFSDSHGGVLKLDTTAKPGTELSQLYKLDDYIIDVETKVLTHRPDMFGHLGFARELSAALGKKFTSPSWYLKTRPDWPEPRKKLAITIDNQLSTLVPRFTLVAYDEVIVSDSPTLMQSWLMRLGIRPVNNIVDITNYIMLLTGQPMHAFDYDKVKKSANSTKFVVRHPKAKETLELIDGKIIQPHKESIVIAAESIIGLGGIMGGRNAEVDKKTKRIVLEAANFNMYSIRNTAMSHGLSSEAVTRFARGQDPETIAAVQFKAMELVTDLTGAKSASKLVDSYGLSQAKRRIKTTSSYINQLIGLDKSATNMAATLKNAELDTKVNKDSITVAVPSWRRDLTIPADIAEEVGRLGGYGHIKATTPTRTIEPSEWPKQEQLESQIKQLLSAGGANEVLSYSAVPEKLIEGVGQSVDLSYKIRNALSPDVQLMRLSLMPSLLEKIYPNLRQGHKRFALFEIGTSHNKRLIENKLPLEQHQVAFVYTVGKNLQSSSQGAAYFIAKHYLDYVLKRLGYQYELSQSSPRDDPWLDQVIAPFEQSRSAFVTIDKQIIGVVGEFTNAATQNAKLPLKTAGFEFNLGRLLASKTPGIPYTKPTKYPTVLIDLTLKSPPNLAYDKLHKAISSSQIGNVHYTFWPLEIFVASNKNKHTSFRFEFSNPERTLTQPEVNSWLSKIVKHVNKHTGASQV